MRPRPSEDRLGPCLLFCPGDRPDRYGKALAAADAVIIDLEDAVGPAFKEEARRALAETLPSLPLDRVVVRINAPRSVEGALDLEMIKSTPIRYAMVPKVETPDEIERLAPLMAVGLCETALGIERAYEIASASNCVALMWGGEDLTADIGGRSSRGLDGRYLDHVQYARARTLIAASAAGKQAWDGVYLDIPDHAGLERECHDGVAMGFAAKVAIHPVQAAIIRGAYRPSDAQLDWAKRLLAAAEAAGSGVVSFEGRMVDGPLLTMARRVIASHSRYSAHRSGESVT